VLSSYAAADRPLPPMQDRLIALRNVVAPGYFSALGIPLRLGRDFAGTDRAASPSVAIVNRTMAQRLFGTENAIGKRVVLGITDRTVEIVGIVGDIRVEAVATPPKPEIYFSFLERPRVSFTLILRTDDEAALLAPSVRAVLRNIDRDIPLINPRNVSDEVMRSLSSHKTSLALLGLFAGTALVLAALGIYSVMAYLVLQRTGEISIRLLLGARASQIRRLIVGQGARLTAVGLVLGLAGAVLVRQIMTRVLYGVPAVHLPTYFIIAAFLGSVSLAACWLAARRATKVDPLLALRAE
jgi:putative ABC transport system permease protein